MNYLSVQRATEGQPPTPAQQVAWRRAEGLAGTGQAEEGEELDPAGLGVGVNS